MPRRHGKKVRERTRKHRKNAGRRRQSKRDTR